MTRIANPALALDAIEGLTSIPKAMSPKWFYDETGSRLFEEITAVPEYYPTRTETEILGDRAADLAAAIPEDGALVELGSGASVKTRILLDAAPHLALYVPVDVSADFLERSAQTLVAAYPALRIRPVIADFTAPFDLPRDVSGHPVVGFFPGSTVGNLDRADAVRLLTAARRWDGATAFILGADLVKDEATLLAAYDDPGGQSARFNLNLLHRLNREAAAGFDVDAFAHEARWNADASRIEMHIVSRKAQTVEVAGRPVRFEAGESIHTENSRKYTRDSLVKLATEAHWSVEDIMTDHGEWFAVAVLRPA